MTEAYAAPLPVPQPESDRYWEGLRAGEIWLRKCRSCRRAYFYPRDFCPHCFSGNVEWFISNGRGTLYTFSIVHRAPHPGFADDVPYVAALVELEDGVRIPTNIVGVDHEPEQLKIGMRLRPVFDAVTDDVTLLKFSPV